MKSHGLTNLLDILRQYWRYDNFRPLQEDIMRSVLGDKDTLALLPTGGGKSLCYQVPALARPGLCLVVSPLIALMKDQVDQLRRRGITAVALTSGMSRKDMIVTLRMAGESNCKFLYVSPERLGTDLFREYLPSLPVNLIAVDEAHCVSQWGYDFRPAYLRIATLREDLPDVPILALTASATPEVLDDISVRLSMDKPVIFRLPFTRPNLSYSVFRIDTPILKIAEILEKVPGSGLVYCKSRRSTEEISNFLRGRGIGAEAYHAGLSSEERAGRQEDWLKDRIRVMVCTNAFGMGIDKPSVRTVIHVGPPESPENYYQESGRAGRDGKRAYAVLLTHGGDIERLKALPDNRFPSMDKIREIYQALMNYLQLPTGSGEGNYYDFIPEKFTDTCRSVLIRRPGNAVPGGRADTAAIDTATIQGAISLLEQTGLFQQLRQVFLPAKARFITGKSGLYEFEKDHAAFAPLIHALLRRYEGIFDNAVSIREKDLAFTLRMNLEDIRRLLLQLQAYQIIDYEPAKDSPQLYFFRNRVSAGELYIDPVWIRERKEIYSTRIRAMVRYMELDQRADSCRSRYLAVYFGDHNAGDCGICDNCLAARKPLMTAVGP